MKNTKLNSTKKLKEYSLLAGAFLGMAGVASAQIEYTDINPDVTLATDGDFYLLDLNNDGVNDFRLEFHSQESTFTYYGYNIGFRDVHIVDVSPLHNNAIAGASTYFTLSYSETEPIAYNLSPGIPIDENQNWKITDDNILAASRVLSVQGSGYSAQYGQWENQNDKYLGLKLKVAGQTYYGWARLDVASYENDLETVIKDYAFQSQADLGIEAGTITKINKTILDKKLNIYGFDNSIFINAKELNGLEGIITVYNELGQSVYNSKLIDAQTKISIDNNGGQLYLVNVRVGDAVISKKVVLGN